MSAGIGSYPFAEGRRVVASLGLAVGDGPIYAVGQGPDAVYSLYNGRKTDDRSYQCVLWLADSAYRGPLLIRARQLDGDAAPSFMEDRDGPLQSQIQLPIEGRGNLPESPGWRLWKAYTVLSSPGQYAYHIDGADFSRTINFQVVQERPNQLFPLPPFRRLPRELIARSAVPTNPGRIRLALTGTRSLALQIDTAPTSTAPLDLTGSNVQRRQVSTGPVLWQVNEQWGWPGVAVWDDGRYRYHLILRDSAPGNWSSDDLLQLIEAFAAAGER